MHLCQLVSSQLLELFALADFVVVGIVEIGWIGAVAHSLGYSYAGRTHLGYIEHSSADRIADSRRLRNPAGGSIDFAHTAAVVDYIGSAECMAGLAGMVERPAGKNSQLV